MSFVNLKGTFNKSYFYYLVEMKKVFSISETVPVVGQP